MKDLAFLPFPGAEIILQDDGGRYLVYKSFVLTGLLLKASFEHRPMGQHGGEALIVILDGNRRHSLAPAGYELLHALQVLTGQAVRLAWLTYHDPLHWFPGCVSLQPVEKL